jgi:hypothetical protein
MLELVMCTAEEDSLKNSTADQATTKPETPVALDTAVPPLEDLFEDAAVRQRIGKIIATTAWRVSPDKW